MAGLTFNMFGHDVSASKTLNGIRGSLGDIGKVAGGIQLSKMFDNVKNAGVNFFKGAFDEATEAQKVGAQTTAVLKSTGSAAGITAGQIGDLATSISNKVGIDDEAIQSGENLLLTFTNLKNGAGAGNDIFNQTTQIMTDMSVALGTDTKSSAIQLGKALNDPIKGVGKLQKVGVTFTDAQKKQIKALQDSGDTMGAQKIILRELNKEFGGSAAAQVTPAEKAKVAWGNLQEQIGTGLMPIVTTLANFLTQHVIPALSKLAGWIQKNTSWLGPLVAIVGGVIALWKAWAIAQAALNLVMEANPILLVVTAIALLATGLYLAWQKSETFRSIVTGTFNKVRDAGQFMWNNVLKPVLSALKTAFRGVGDGIRWAWNNVIRPTFDLIKAGVRLVRDVVRQVVGIIAAIWRTVGDGLQWAWNNIISPVYGWVKSGIGRVRDIVRAAASKISGFFRGMGSGLRWVWDHTIGPVINAMIRAFQRALDLYNIIKGNPNGITSSGGTVGGGVVLGGPVSPRARAQGDGFFPGGLTTVGENGRELVRLPRGTKIDSQSVAASKARMMGGGQNINLTVTVQGGLVSQADVQRTVHAALEYSLNSGNVLNVRPGAIRVH